MQEIYLDNNATTKPLNEVVGGAVRTMSTAYGNPSSPHHRGEIARRTLLEARQRVAGLVRCEEGDIIFTSGGTEANNLVIRSLCGKGSGARLVTTSVEHSSVLKAAHALEDGGCDVAVLAVGPDGTIDIAHLVKALKSPTSLVSVQWANSETGTVQNIDRILKVCKAQKVPLHVDAAQAVGKLPIELNRLPVDFLTFSAHKIHGLQGVGAVATKHRSSLVPSQLGGDQEHGIRPGTENLPGIVSFGHAALIRSETLNESAAKMRALRNRFEGGVLAGIPDAVVNGNVDGRVVNTTNIRFPGVEGMAMQANLDSAGIYCSLTSACVSARPEPSHVLLAMGLSEQEAYGSIRFSFSVQNTDEEAEVASRKVCEIYQRLAGLGNAEGMAA